MYYIEKEVSLQNGLQLKNLGLHIITQLRLDRINKEVEVQICSYESRKDWAEGIVGAINSFLLKFDVDPYVSDVEALAWNVLLGVENGIFSKAELQQCDTAEFYKEA